METQALINLFDSCNKTCEGKVTVSDLISAIEREFPLVECPDSEEVNPRETLIKNFKDVLDPFDENVEIDINTWLTAWDAYTNSLSEPQNTFGNEYYKSSVAENFNVGDVASQGGLNQSNRSFSFSPGSSSLESEPDELRVLKQHNQELLSNIKHLQQQIQNMEDGISLEQRERKNKEKEFLDEIHRLLKLKTSLQESIEELKLSLDINEKEKLELCSSLKHLSGTEKQLRIKHDEQKDEIDSLNTEICRINKKLDTYKIDFEKFQHKLREQAIVHQEQEKELQKALQTCISEKEELTLKLSVDDAVKKTSHHFNVSSSFPIFPNLGDSLYDEIEAVESSFGSTNDCDQISDNRCASYISTFVFQPGGNSSFLDSKVPERGQEDENILIQSVVNEAGAKMETRPSLNINPEERRVLHDKNSNLQPILLKYQSVASSKMNEDINCLTHPIPTHFHTEELQTDKPCNVQNNHGICDTKPQTVLVSEMDEAVNHSKVPLHIESQTIDDRTVNDCVLDGTGESCKNDSEIQPKKRSLETSDAKPQISNFYETKFVSDMEVEIKFPSSPIQSQTKDDATDIQNVLVGTDKPCKIDPEVQPKPRSPETSDVKSQSLNECDSIILSKMDEEVTSLHLTYYESQIRKDETKNQFFLCDTDKISLNCSEVQRNPLTICDEKPKILIGQHLLLESSTKDACFYPTNNILFGTETKTEENAATTLQHTDFNQIEICTTYPSFRCDTDIQDLEEPCARVKTNAFKQNMSQHQTSLNVGVSGNFLYSSSIIRNLSKYLLSTRRGSSHGWWKCVFITGCVCVFLCLLVFFSLLFTVAMLDIASESGVLFSPYNGSVPPWLKRFVQNFVKIHRRIEFRPT